MAEFKLGRIKFVYQGAWQANYAYVVDDVVTNGGKTYICVIANTSSSLFATDLAGPAGTTKWNLIADGQSWRGTWSNATLYNPGDLVVYGGTVYQCTTANTSVASTLTLTATSLTTNGSGTATLTYATQANGAPFVVGQTITLAGFTPTSTSGTVNTIAGTYTVISCNSTTLTFALTGTYTATSPFGTVSGTGYLESQINDWTAFASNLNWAGQWTTSTKYKIDDLIYYGGVTYVCTTAHVSASTATLGLEANQSYWTPFNAGLNYLGAWATNTRYKLNDLVKYGADIWICVTPHTSSGLTINTTNFNIFVNGLEFENSWSNALNYAVGDLVTYGGYTYTAILDNIGQVPSTSPTYWQIFTTGLVYSGAWVTGTQYKIGSVVTLGGFTYVAIADNTSSQPSSTNANWGQLNPGIRWAQPTSTTYTSVSGINVIGTGSSALFDITLTGTTYSAIVHSGASGSGYAANNTIKILGTNLGGLSPANDLLLTVGSVSSGAISTINVTSGFAVTWCNGTTYLVGDAVYYSNSSYICVSSHVGILSTNDPVSDVNATYWNLLAQGANGGVLTTTGDMVYFGNNGATRLPIGTDGQILRVSGNTPAWQYYGLLQNVVYVASTGTDVVGNSQGQSLDKPWATVAFAAKQIEDGYLNINAGAALKANKQFMLKEVAYWITTQYSFNITGSSASGNTFVVGGTSTTSQTTTANMYYGMPITFSTAIVSQIIPGTIYYVNTITSSTTFTISTSYKSGSPLPITGGSSTAGTAIFNYTVSKAERDAGTLIDGVIFDLTHGGNLYCVTATQTFFSTLTSLITTNATYEINVWVASLQYLQNTLFTAALTNTPPLYSYQTIQGIPLANQAVQNTTSVLTSNIESGALTLSQNLLGIVTTALSAGTYANIPQTQRPHTSIYLKTGTFNEYGPIVIPQDTALVGDELRSTIVQAATAQPYLINDITRASTALRRIQNLVPAIASNIPVITTSTNTAVQQYIGTSPYSTITSTLSTLTGLLETALSSGLGSSTTTITYASGTVTVPSFGTFTYTTPTGFGSSLSSLSYACSGNITGSTVGYNAGVAQISQNITFIQTEIAAYMYANYNSVWTAMGSTNQGATLRDVGYLLNALQYDMTYGGNIQSTIDGLAYYSLGTASIISGYQAATTAMITRIQTIIPYIVTANTGGWTPTSGNSASQVTTGTAGSTNAGTYAASLVGIVLNWVNGTNGTGNSLSNGDTLSSTVQPCYTWVSTSLQNAFASVQSNKTTIQSWIKNWVSTNYPLINSALTYRDAGTIVDALSYDLLLGSQYYTTVSARAFYRNVTSAQNLINNVNGELTVTENAINYIGAQVAGYATGSTTGSSGVSINLGSTITNSIATNNATLQGILANGFNYSAVFGSPNTTTIAGTTLTSTQYGTLTSGTTGSFTIGTPVTSGILYNGQSVTLTGTISTSTISGTVSLSTTNGNTFTLGTSTTLVVGQQITITGTFSSGSLTGYTSGTVYYIISTNGTTTFTVSTSIGGTATVATASTGNVTGLTLTVTPISGYVSGNTYLISTTNGTSTFTLSTTSNGQIYTTSGAITGLSITLNVAVPNAGTFTLSQPTGFVAGSLTNTAYACSGNATGSTTGYAAGVTAIQNNIAFIQTEIAAYMYANYNSVWAAMGGVYQGRTLRDVAYLLQSLQYDMTYGGNSQSQIDGLAYYSLGTSSITSTYQTSTNAMLTRIQTIISNIVTGTAITKTALNAATQNTSSSGSTNAGTYANTLVGTVITIFGSGSNSNTNSQSEGSITGSTVVLPYYGWATQAQQNAFAAIQAQKSYIQTQIQTFIATQYPNNITNLALTYRDAGTIVDTLSYDMVLGTNYFTLVSGRAFYRYVTSAQNLISATELAATQAATQYIGYYVGALATSSTQLPTLTGDFGNPSAVNLVINNASIIQNMFANGLTITPGVQNNTNYTSYNGLLGTLQEPAFVITPVTNYNTYYLVGFGNGVTQIQNNYQFIKDEIVAYLIYTLGGSVWAGYGPTYQAETIRDLSSILDALQYDLTYGCNTQSLIVGSSYYSLNTPLIVPPYSTGVTAALNRLLAIISNIVTAGTVTPTSGNSTSQSTSGSAGSAAAGAFAVARVNDIIYWLNKGLANPTTGVGTATFSGTTMTVSAVSSGTFAVGQCVTGTTLTTTATAVNGSTGAVTLTSVAGLLAGMPITFSTTYGSGTQSVFGNLTTTTYTINGISGSTVTLYTYGTTNAPNLVTATGQLTVTAGVAPGTYITSIGSTNGGTGNYSVSVSQSISTATTVTGTFAITPIVSGAYNFATSANQLSFNAIQAQSTLIANDAQGWVTKFFQNEGPSLSLTNRDAGYVVTALAYDVLFNNNFYSIITGRSYNRLIPLSAGLQQLYADATYGVIGWIGQRVKVVAAAGSIVQTQTTIDDMIAQLYGQSTTSATFTGTVNGTQLTISSISTGAIVPGMPLTGVGVANGTSTVSGATTTLSGIYISSNTGVFGCTALPSPLVVGQQVTITGTFSAGSISGYTSGTIYYVIGTPTTTLFQLSAVQGGTALTTVAAGSSGSPLTGITFVASPTTWLLNYSQSVSSTVTSIQNVIATTNYITMGTTAGMVPGLTITITGTAISNLSAGTYYIKQVLNTTELTISSSYNGPTFVITPSNTLTGVVITSTSGTFTCSPASTALTVGLPVTISGTNTGSGGIYAYSTPTTYYIVTTNGSTTFTLSATIGGSPVVTTAGTPTGWTVAVGATGAMVATVYGIYGGLGLSTSLTGTSTNIPVTAVTTSTNAITLSSDAGVYVNMPIVFNGLPSPIQTTAISTTTSTNIITLSATAASLGIIAGQQVYFTGMMLGKIVFNQIYYVINPTGSTIQISNTLGGSAVALTSSPALSTVAITGTAGQFSCASYSTLYVGQAITINGTLSAGTINGSATVTAQTFYIIATNGTTTFTLSATLGGVAIATTSGGTITGTTFGVNAQMNVTVNAAGGLVNGNTYWVNTVASGTYPAAGTSITVSSSFKSGTAFTITNSLTGLTATATIGIPTVQGLAAKIVNGLSQPWGNITGAYQSYPGYNNTLATIEGGELLRINKTLLSNEAVYYTQATYSSTATGTATNGVITTSTPHNLLVNDPVQFGLTGAIFDGNLSVSTIYWVLTTPSSTTFTVTTTQPGTGTQTVLTLVGGSGTMGVNYYINTTNAKSTQSNFVDSLVYDIGLTGNYKSTRFVQLYLSQVNGSQYTDMFHIRNGTGIRNMTGNGLQGTLTLPNSLGTKRPTGGSYVSFDPGFGPNDSSVWIFNRSPYTQNITNFGNGCVGMKLDAALHNGGYKSMVSNDFTQVLSDGIGVWCTGHGAITEAVSVFCYYGYAGYMSELGGRIRATNGNSSYGTYGVIAEGTDSYEIPGYSTINNRGNPAYITNVVTDQTNYVFRFEYANAGGAYTNYVPTISGAGYNATALGDEFRDSAVFETRLVDLNNGQGVGGSNYLTIANTAQSGTIGQITIANSDTQLSSAYVGMRVFLTGGTGVGQYATSLNYTSGSKIINVYRQNFVPLTITTNSTSVFTVASTITMYANQPIYLGASIGGLTGLTTVYYVVGSSLSSNGTTFSVSTSSGGSAATLTATSSTPAVMNSSTIVGTTLTVGTLASGTIYAGMLISGTGVASNTYIVSNISGSGTGSTWTVSVSQNLATTNLTGTISVQVYEAGWDHSVPGYATVNTLDATTTYIIEPLITYSSPGLTTTGTTVTSAQYGAVTYGNGNFVATTSTGTGTQYSTNGSTWNPGGILPASTTWTNLVYGGGQNATGTAVIGGLGGSGCVLQAVLGTGSTAGQIVGITVVNGGNNYSTPPTIVITDSSGSGAVAIAEVLSGAVANVYMVITGSIYSNPTVTAVTSELSSITANTWGINYYTSPTVIVSPPYAATQWTASTAAVSGNYYYNVDATVSPNVTNYYLATTTGTFSSTAPTFTNAFYGKSGVGATGLGASGTYGVALTYVGSLPIVTANLTNNGVSSYTVTQAGYGYTTTPTVTVVDPFAAYLAVSSSSNATAFNAGQPTPSSEVLVVSSSSTTITLAYAVSLPQNAPITFATSFGTGVTAGVTYYVAATTSSSTSLTIASSINGAPITVGTGTSLSIIGTVSASTNLTASWTSGTSTGQTTLKALAYGNNYYIAVGGSGSAAAVSLYNATNLATATWVTQSSNITANSSGYTAIAYGAGLFCAIGGTVSSWMQSNPTSWATGGTLTSKTWVSLAYGNGRFVALASDGTLQYTYNWQPSLWTGTSATNNTWITVKNNPLNASGVTTWKNISYGEGQFVAVATSSQAIATSWDGLNWTYYATGMPSSSNWVAVAFGNPQNATLGAVPTWVGVSNTSGTTAALIQTGARPLGRVKIVSNAITEIRMIEPGSGFPRGNVSGTTTSTNLITVDSTVNLAANMPIVFNGTSAGGIVAGKYYYVVSGSITSTQFQISLSAGSTAIPLSSATITGMTYFAGPVVTITDPNHVNSAPVTPRIGNGALGNPSITNRGVGDTTATATVSGDGYSDIYQTGNYINVAGLYSIPSPGSNITFATITGSAQWYKLVAVTNQLGIPGNYTATFQINPSMSVLLAPPNGTQMTTRLLYSNTRMTGHDFLYIGTGGVTATNYPNVNPQNAVIANQTLSTGGGRVFFTSTDQDGNFNVGNLFGVQQATGTASLNASAFNLSGLQSLTLGSVSLGIGSATITQFSTDPYFTANSDAIVPTQKAIKSYITSQIGGGQSALNVNTITSGQVYIAGNVITTTTGVQLYVSSKMLFTGGIDGAPVALAFFSQR